MNLGTKKMNRKEVDEKRMKMFFEGGGEKKKMKLKDVFRASVTKVLN